MKFNKKVKITKDGAYSWLLFCLVSRKAFVFVISKMLSLFRINVMTGMVLAIVMLGPIVVTIIQRFNRSYFEICFISIYLFFEVFFLLIGAFHQNYIEYFTRPVFGVYEVFFGIERGAIWGILAFGYLRDGKRVLKCLYSGSFLLLAYSLYELYRARVVGYWETYNSAGVMTKYNYSLTFGYQVMLCCIVFLYHFFEHKKWYDLGLSLLALFLTVFEGSRGPLICFSTFIILYVLINLKRQNFTKRLLFAGLLLFFYIVFSLTWNDFLSWLTSRLLGINSNSRIIKMFLSGDITSDSSRSKIYGICWETISKQGFFGIGPFGNRVNIAPLYYWGYPHNIVLEIIMDYGWTIATIIMVMTIIGTIKMFISIREEELMVFCILLSNNMKLFMSSTYWGEYMFWGMLSWMFMTLTFYKKHMLMNKHLRLNG